MAHHDHRLVGDIYRPCAPVPEDVPQIRGYDFNRGVDHKALLQSYFTTGFQATHFGLAVKEINAMIKKRQEPMQLQNGKILEDPSTCPCLRSCTIFLSYTSNLISSGLRETIRYLAQHQMVDVLVTTAGGIEEDFIKCLAPVFLGDFRMSGKELYKRGLNRTGNTLMPEYNYKKFDTWIMPILEKMYIEQEELGVNWTPSKMIQRFGQEINNTDSVYYWAYKNNIPVFCPALTDGAIGDMLYLFARQRPGLRLDIIGDMIRLLDLVTACNKSGMISLGGGVAKHHVLNANAWRDGADYAVYVNTAQEFDGCDSGAAPEEAVSWGKININAQPVKVCGDATIIFPLLVAETFAAQDTQQKTC